MLTSPKVSELSDAEFRALVVLWSWVARYGEEGEFPRKWLRGFAFVAGDRRRRITPRMVKRFIDLELIEEHEYVDDGTQVLVIADWREFRPADLTSAERKRRFRHRLYENRYHGTLGDVAEVVLPTPEEIAATEEAGRAFWEEFERAREVTS
ncbi:MAG: hypothetical protein ACR2M2_07775 [Gaiellaceae bacterium]